MKIDGIEVGNCANCPAVHECLTKIRVARLLHGVLAEAGMSSLPDERAADIFGQISSLGEGVIAHMTKEGIETIESPAEMARFFRSNVGELLAKGDEAIESQQKEIAGLVEGCEKPLSMRAERSGQVVVATICMSPCRPEGKNLESVLVRRQQSGA